MSLSSVGNASVEDDEVYIFPASFSQESLWFLDQLEPNRAIYNVSGCFRLKGPLDWSILEQAFNALLQRHETLRTTFMMLEGQLVQVISPIQRIALQLLDVGSLTQSEREAEALRQITAEAQRPFDLTDGPLLRATGVQVAAEEHLLLLSIHHIIADEWSLRVLYQELSTLYSALLHNQPSSLPPLIIQYADFAVWQRQWLHDEVLASQLAYWQEQLSGAPALLELPTDYPRPAVRSFRGAQHRLVLSQELTEALKGLSRRKGVTLFMTVLAAFKVLLSRYSGQTDIVVGSPIANRNRSGTEGLVSLFVNMLVLRTDLSEDPSFEQVLRRVSEVALRGYAHQDVPFEKVVEHLNPERSLSHNPLFQVMFTLQSDPTQSLKLPNIQPQLVEVDNGIARFDLSLTLKETDQGLMGLWEYSTDLFESATMGRMAGHFQTLLEGIVASPEQLISKLPLLTAAERQQLLVEWNATKSEYPLDQCIHHLFEEQVERTPEAIAVAFEGEQLSYRELNAHANRLAHYLREHGVESERIVALLAERGIPFLISILAVFKAGGAYLPLDPNHPPARLRQVIELSRCSIVLATTPFAPVLAHTLEEVPTELRPKSLYYEEVLQESQNEGNLPASGTSCDLAYVIYTSGSTGQPKGAMVEQRGMVNHISDKIESLALTSHDSVAQTASQGFVISVWQFLAALLVGGKVQIYPDEVTHHPVELLTQIEQHQVSILETVPSLMRAMLDADEVKAASRPKLEALRWLITTGEALPVDLCQRWLRTYLHVPLLNTYGPTECSDDVARYSIYEAPDKMGSSVPIGRAIPNVRLYVLDRHLESVPIGVSGELYIGGVGVGRGYLGDEQRTKEAFVTDPFGSENGARLYKTGDLVRYLPDGNLEFVGRQDFQVKLHGIRIELGEIEAVLMQHSGVKQAVVMVREDVLDDKRLVAYIVPRQGQAVGASNLRSHVIKQLPAYMVPSVCVLLEALPLTSSGKLNRRALPVPEYNFQGLESSLVMPQTPLQETIAASWVQVLRMAQVGIHDNFFALGGDSLLALQVLSRLHEALHVALTLHGFFAAPTIAELSEIIEQVKTSEAQQHLSAPRPLS